MTNSSVLLLAGWLAVSLECPVRTHLVTENRQAQEPDDEACFAVVHSEPGVNWVRKVVLTRPGGDLVFEHDGDSTLTISQPGYPVRRVMLPRPSLGEVLVEELRRLDADSIYEKALTTGLNLVAVSPEPTPETLGACWTTRSGAREVLEPGGNAAGHERSASKKASRRLGDNVPRSLLRGTLPDSLLG